MHVSVNPIPPMLSVHRTLWWEQPCPQQSPSGGPVGMDRLSFRTINILGPYTCRMQGQEGLPRFTAEDYDEPDIVQSGQTSDDARYFGSVWGSGFRQHFLVLRL